MKSVASICRQFEAEYDQYLMWRLMKTKEFAKELKALCLKYNIGLGLDVAGLRCTELDEGEYRKSTLKYRVEDTVQLGQCRDKNGPFLVAEIELKEKAPERIDVSTSFIICNKEKVMGEGVRSQLDGKVYTSRRAYETHLKDNECHIKDYTMIKRPEQVA